MAFQKKLKIPEDSHEGFAAIIALEGEQLLLLEHELENASPKLKLFELETSILKNIENSGFNFKGILRVLFSLYNTRSNGKVPIEEFVDQICDALNESNDESVHPPNGNWQPFKDKLKRLLKFDHSVGVTIKAVDVMTQHQHVYISGETRILSDIRPIFTEDLQTTPDVAAIIHTLKIAFLKDGDLSEFYVALDNQDLMDLRRLLERAEMKEQYLRKILDDSDLEYLDPGKD